MNSPDKPKVPVSMVLPVWTDYIETRLLPDFGGTGLDFMDPYLRNTASVRCDVTRKLNTDHPFLGFEYLSSSYTLPISEPTNVTKLHEFSLSAPQLLQRRKLEFIDDTARIRNFLSTRDRMDFCTRGSLLNISSHVMDNCHVKIMLPEVVEQYIRRRKMANPVQMWPTVTGCLQHMKLGLDTHTGNQSDVIVHTGNHPDVLVSTWLERDLKSPCGVRVLPELTRRRASDGGPIHQLTSSSFSQYGLVGVRHKRQVNLFSLTNPGDEPRLLGQLVTSSPTADMDISCMSGQYAWMSLSGSGYICDIETFKTVTTWSIESENESSLRRSCHFGAHPRCVLSADTSRVFLTDTRIHSEQTTTLFSLQDYYLPEDNCSIRLIRPRPQDPSQSYVATTRKLLLLDHRFIRNPICVWNHLLPSVSYMTTTTLPEVDFEVVTLGCPSSPDMAWILASRVSPQDGDTHYVNDNISQSAVRFLSRPEDALHYLTRDGRSVDEVTWRRTRMPLVGGCCVAWSDRHSGFTMLQGSSTGDLYGQPYVWNKRPGASVERSHRAGAGAPVSRGSPKEAEWCDMATRLWTCPPEVIRPAIVSDLSKMHKAISKESGHRESCPICCHGDRSSHVHDVTSLPPYLVIGESDGEGGESSEEELGDSNSHHHSRDSSSDTEPIVPDVCSGCGLPLPQADSLMFNSRGYQEMGKLNTDSPPRPYVRGKIKEWLVRTWQAMNEDDDDDDDEDDDDDDDDPQVPVDTLPQSPSVGSNSKRRVDDITDERVEKEPSYKKFREVHNMASSQNPSQTILENQGLQKLPHFFTQRPSQTVRFNDDMGF